MKKGNISIGVAIALVALLFAGTGIALAGTEDIDAVYFHQESMVEGTGLVMVDKDINTAPEPGYPVHNLETNLHIHGCGDYEVDQVITVVVVKNYKTPSGKINRNVSQSIDFCEDAEMTFKPVALTSGSMTLIDDESSIKWKEDLCIKNYQINTAMRAKYTDADYIKKTIVSNVSCVEPYKTNEECDPWYNKESALHGYGLAKMDILSTVSGASHVGVVVKDDTDPSITMIRVSEDYIGNFTIEKHMKVKMHKPVTAKKDDKDWLPCPWDMEGGDC
ncbi:hypothetical protein C4E24_00095 [ANME-1 cluster archaeon AG-394-G21]|nr:hypothetical protein [ANME-1 cluster archaeon AG-394-G21]